MLQTSTQIRPVAEANPCATEGATTPKSTAHSVSHVIRWRIHPDMNGISIECFGAGLYDLENTAVKFIVSPRGIELNNVKCRTKRVNPGAPKLQLANLHC